MNRAETAKGRDMETRWNRQAIDLHNSPLIIAINVAGHRMGRPSRADASEAMRLYIERKKYMMADCTPPYMEVRSSGRLIRGAYVVRGR